MDSILSGPLGASWALDWRSQGLFQQARARAGRCRRAWLVAAIRRSSRTRASRATPSSSCPRLHRSAKQATTGPRLHQGRRAANGGASTGRQHEPPAASSPRGPPRQRPRGAVTAAQRGARRRLQAYIWRSLSAGCIIHHESHVLPTRKQRNRQQRRGRRQRAARQRRYAGIRGRCKLRRPNARAVADVSGGRYHSSRSTGWSSARWQRRHCSKQRVALPWFTTRCC